MGAQGQQQDGLAALVLRVLEDDTQIVARRASPTTRQRTALRQPTTARASPRRMAPYRGVPSATAAGRVRMPASVAAPVSRLCLAHQLRRGNGLALSGGEFLARLCHGGGHTL